MINAYLYYHLNDSVIDDDQYTAECLHLSRLQQFPHDVPWENEQFTHFTHHAYAFDFSNEVKNEAKYFGQIAQWPLRPFWEIYEHL